MAPSLDGAGIPEVDTAHFGPVDYCVFVGLLLVSLGIGVYHAFKGNKNPEEFLLGGRSMSTFPVAVSLLSSFISAISILGTSGETYAHGTQLSMMLVGDVVGVVLASVLFLPVFYPLKMTSVNEYIEYRFSSRFLRLASLALNTFIGLIYSGLCLFAPTLALASVTPLSVDQYILIMGVVCTLYSTIGGLKAVVWTDVFQMGVVLAGVVAVIVVGCVEVGGVGQVWAISQEHGRIQFFDLNISLHQRHTLANVVMMGTVMFLSAYGVSQTNLQRVCSVPSLRQANQVLYLNMVGMLVLCILLYFSGLCAFATYYGCDPITRGLISSKDQIMPYFVMDKMGFLYGMPGLFVATLFSGALSSLSSVINSVVAMLWSDVVSPLPFFRHLSRAGGAVVNKVLSLIVGGLMIGIAFFAKHFGGLIQAAMTITGVMGGPMLGLFMLGVLVPHCDRRGASLGLVSSAVFVSWIAMGGYMYGSKPEYLPLNADHCPVPNATAIPASIPASIPSTTLPPFIQGDLEGIYDGWLGEESSTVSSLEDMGDDDEFALMALYRISYTLYPLIGLLTCLVVAILVTIATGGQDLRQVRPELVCPLIRCLLPSDALEAQYYPVASVKTADSPVEIKQAYFHSRPAYGEKAYFDSSRGRFHSDSSRVYPNLKQ